jgi:cation:H+ antiporter
VTPSAATAVFVVGAILSLTMSWLLVSRLEMVGERYGLSEALLGLLAALAADTPEITAAVTALVHHQRAVGAGVVIGSNVFNLAALLGVGAIVARRIDLHRKVVVLGGAVAMWMALVCLGCVGGVVSPGLGLGLVVVVLVPYGIALSSRRGALRRLGLPPAWTSWLGSAVEEEELELVAAIRPRPARPRDALAAAGALVVVVVASVAMERGASTLGQRDDVAGVIIGGLVLAAVTSLPNAVAAVYLARRGRGAAALSVALNSNAINVAAGLLLPATVVGLTRSSGPTVLIAAWYLGLTVATLLLAYRGRGLGRWSGWFIIAGYAGFVVCLLVAA